MNSYKNSTPMLAAVGIILITILSLGICRAIFALHFIPLQTIMQNSDCIPLLLLNALRFDAQVGAYAAIPVVIWALVFYTAKLLRHSIKTVPQKVYIIYGTVIAAVAALFAISDLHYYHNFSKHFDVLVFDFQNQEPGVLIKGIIAETPFVKYLSIIAAVTLVCNITLKSLCRHAPKPWPNIAVCEIVMLTVIAICLRGSLGKFTLRAEDIQVSGDARFNDLTPNAFYMLKKAKSEKKREFALLSNWQILAEGGFADYEELAQAFYEAKMDSATLFNHIWAKSSSTPRYRGYNIVLIIAESWGSVPAMLLDKQYPQWDLLGDEMRTVMQHSILFPNCLSSTNGTINCITQLTTQSPYDRLFQSGYRAASMPTATAQMFREAGYRTIFATGLESNWQNLCEALPCQGFDKVAGKREIKQEYPLAEVSDIWGVFDHSLLDYTRQELEKEPEMPKFMMLLTTTAHTPFQFPQSYQADKLDVSGAKEIMTCNEQMFADYMHGMRYESRAIAGFISNLRKSPQGDSTIVIVTGDHHMRTVIDYNKFAPHMQYTVPLLINLPDAQGVQDTTLVSHHDIVPTMAWLALDSAQYLNIGCNLTGSCRMPAAVNSDFAIAATDSCNDAIQYAKALNAIKKLVIMNVLKQKRN